MKAIGAQDRPIILMVLSEILITACIGGVIGYAAGIGFAQIIGKTVFDSYIEINLLSIPIVAVIVILMTILGSIPAIKYLLQLKPTEVLHGR